MKAKNSDRDKEVNNQSNKNGEINQNSGQKSLDSDMFNKLRNINVSLSTEKNYTCFFKKLNKNISSNNTYKEIYNGTIGNNKEKNKEDKEKEDDKKEGNEKDKDNKDKDKDKDKENDKNSKNNQ